MKHPVVIITGTSSGIGMALAKQLYHSHYRVVATARERSLHHLAKVGLIESERFLTRALDVTIDLQRHDLIAEIIERWGRIDILVNNAGVAYRGVIEHWGKADIDRQMAVNFTGPMALIRDVLPTMRKQKRGRIINVSSVAGMMAMPTMGLYSASKFALEGATEALWYEMQPWGVDVTLLQLGFIRSDSFKNTVLSGGAQLSVEHDDDYSAYYWNMNTFVAHMMKHALATPAKVAGRIVTIMETKKPPLRYAGTIDAVFFYFLRRLLPRSIFHRVLYFFLPNIRSWGKNDAP